MVSFMSSTLADPGKGVTLSAYISDNGQLLSALAVFSALVVLSDGLSSNLFRYLLTLVFLVGVILVCLELCYKLPKEQSVRLFLFQYVLLWATAGIIAYCIYEYRLISNVILFVPITLLVLFLSLGNIIPIVRKIYPLSELYGINYTKKTTFHKILRGFSFFILLIFSLFSGIYISFGINLFFEILKHFKV